MFDSVSSRRPLPYVGGESTRFKAAPKPLNRTAAKVMCASGAFNGNGAAAKLRSGWFLGAAVAIVAVGSLAIAHGAPPAEQPAPVAAAAASLADLAPSLGLGDHVAVQRAEAPQDGTQYLSAQDRYEIDRFYRMSGAAR